MSPPERRGAPVLPAPDVALGPDLFARVGRFTARVASARERVEGAGAGRLQGVGTEVVGFRPYRPGEDLRQLDWSLYARLRRPFVRVAAREASERWAVVLDTSASMGVGPPGKLQRAAEVAVAIAAVGLRAGAEVRLFATAGGEGPRLTRVGGLTAWKGFLEGLRAEGARGLASFAASAARVRSAGRLFLLGDLLDARPEALSAFARRGRDLFCLQLLAPRELVPGTGPVEWVDAESGRRRRVDVDRDALTRYESRLERVTRGWRVACARHRAWYACRSSAEPFEAIAGVVFGA